MNGIISMLEDLMDLARAGRLEAVIVSALRDDNMVLTRSESHDGRNDGGLVTASLLTYMGAHMNERIYSDDEDDVDQPEAATLQ